MKALFNTTMFIWFDHTSQNFYLKKHSEIIEVLKVFSKPSMFKFNYIEAFSNFIQDSEKNFINIDIQSQTFITIYKISEEKNES